MILITGATGHLGNAVINHLRKTVPASKIVGLARDAFKAGSLKTQGISIRVADYHNPSLLAEAFKGIEKVVLISSNDFNDRLGQHKNVIDAASDAGVRHLVYTGVSMKDINSSLLKNFMIDHFQTEDYVKERKLDYTLLRNNLYAEMIPFYIGTRVLEDGIHFPAGTGRVPFAKRDEMGEVIANILTQEHSINKTYNISADESYSFHDIADELSKISGKTITYTDADPAAYAETLKQSGVPELQREALIGFAAAMRNGDFNVPSDDMKNLLGRKPVLLKEYLQSAF